MSVGTQLLASGLRKHSKLEALNLPHGHSPRKDLLSKFANPSKKRKPTLANKTHGMYIRLG